jgi:hypothetical protein
MKYKNVSPDAVQVLMPTGTPTLVQPGHEVLANRWLVKDLVDQGILQLILPIKNKKD